MRDFSLVTALGSLARGRAGRYPRTVLVKVKFSYRCISNVKSIAHDSTRRKCSRDRIPILASYHYNVCIAQCIPRYLPT